MSHSEVGEEDELRTPQPSFDGIRWSTCSLKDFKQLYWEEAAPCLEAEGLDPTTEKPTHQWFRDHSVRSFLAALRRHHNRSFGEFWSEDLGLGDDDDGYSWASSDEQTVDALEIGRAHV